MISKIRACNYFSVKSSKDFKKEMDEEFDYIVTPNVFNSAVDFENEGWKVERVYGSPGFEIPKEKGRLMFMDSSFPSRKEGTSMTKGGVVVAKLKKTTGASDTMKMTVSYEDRNGKKYTDYQTFQIACKNDNENYYQDASIRKAVLLVRYVNFMKHLLRDARALNGENIVISSMDNKLGIPVPALLDKKDKSHTHSVQLRPLEANSQSLLKQFMDHYEKEVEAIADNTLDKEMQQLIKLHQTVDKKNEKK